MKATGEVMSICTNFEGALMKAIRSLEQHVDCLRSYDYSRLSDDKLVEELKKVDDRRIWIIAEALRRGYSYDMLNEITKIDRWFIDKLAILTGALRRRDGTFRGPSSRGEADRIPGQCDRPAHRSHTGSR